MEIGVEVANDTLLDEGMSVFQVIVAVVEEVGVATMFEISGGCGVTTGGGLLAKN